MLQPCPAGDIDFRLGFHVRRITVDTDTSPVNVPFKWSKSYLTSSKTFYPTSYTSFNMKAWHPYYPKDATVHGYKPNSYDVLEILVYFFGGLVVIALPVLLLAFRGANLSTPRKLAVAWLMLCGFIHTFLEGHFSVYHYDIASRMDFLSQVWKEYGKGDSRYMLRDTFTVCMETVTAFVEGPVCFLTVWSFVKHNSHRYLLQMAVSLGQIYGCVLYFATEYYDGFTHGPMYHPLYFWFYFVFMNVLWIVIPSILVIDSWIHLSNAQLKSDQGNKRKTK